MKLARLTQKLTGWLLGGCGVVDLTATVLVCIALIAFGPGVIV